MPEMAGGVKGGILEALSQFEIRIAVMGLLGGYPPHGQGGEKRGFETTWDRNISLTGTDPA